MLAGDNERLKTENQQLKTQLENARAEIKRFKQKDEDFKKLMPEELWILKFLFNHTRDHVDGDTIMQKLNIDEERADYLLGRLIESGYICETGDMPPRYMIEPKGREAIFHRPI